MLEGKQPISLKTFAKLKCRNGSLKVKLTWKQKPNRKIGKAYK